MGVTLFLTIVKGVSSCAGGPRLGGPGGGGGWSGGGEGSGGCSVWEKATNISRNKVLKNFKLPGEIIIFLTFLLVLLMQPLDLALHMAQPAN